VRFLLIMTALSCAAWIALLFAHGFFWWLSPRLDRPVGGRTRGGSDRSVVAVIPARNEADLLPKTLPTVLAQDYPGPFRVTLVDDRSDDGTADVACASADRASVPLTILSGDPLPDGWSGKVWALHQGTTSGEIPDFFWLTDADIAHEPWVLSALIDRAEADERDLVSVMAKLHVGSGWDRLLIPAFVYFFAKLYPFRRVNRHRRPRAAAAGGCVLVRRGALERAGGFAALRSALIDDCALARRIQESGGRLWLGFSDGVRSVRQYGGLGAVWEMVARSAYTELRYSPLLLAGTVFGMLWLYALPPAALVAGAMAGGWGAGGGWTTAAVGAGAWALMAGSFIPILRHHCVSAVVSPLLPIAGVLYTAMTLSSARRHALGQGGAWKGRTY